MSPCLQDQGPLNQGDELHRQEYNGFCGSGRRNHRHPTHHPGAPLFCIHAHAHATLKLNFFLLVQR